MAALLGAVLYAILYFYYVDPPKSLLPRRGVAAFIISVSMLTLLWRLIYIRVFTAPQFMRRVLIVGGGKNGALFAALISKLNPQPYHLVGFIDDDPEKQNTKIEGLEVLGNSKDILKVIDEKRISDIVAARPFPARRKRPGTGLRLSGTDREMSSDIACRRGRRRREHSRWERNCTRA